MSFFSFCELKHCNGDSGRVMFWRTILPNFALSFLGVTIMPHMQMRKERQKYILKNTPCAPTNVTSDLVVSTTHDAYDTDAGICFNTTHRINLCLRACRSSCIVSYVLRAFSSRALCTPIKVCHLIGTNRAQYACKKRDGPIWVLFVENAGKKSNRKKWLSTDSTHSRRTRITTRHDNVYN